MTGQKSDAVVSQNPFLPGQSDGFYSYFNANEEYEQRFYSNSYDSYSGSDYRRGYNIRKLSKTCSSNYGPKITSCWRMESQEHAGWRKICEELNSRTKSNKYLIEKYRSCDVYFNQ